MQQLIAELIAPHLDESELHKMALVCRTWRQVILPLTYGNAVYLRHDTQWLAEHGRRVKQLKTYTVTDKDLERISTNCPNIKELTLELVAQVSPAAFKRLWQRLTALERIHLRLLDAQMSPLILEPLISNSRLTTLTLSGLYTQHSHQYPSRWNRNILLRVLQACSSTLVHLRLERLLIENDDFQHQGQAFRFPGTPSFASSSPHVTKVNRQHTFDRVGVTPRTDQQASWRLFSSTSGQSSHFQNLGDNPWSTIVSHQHMSRMVSRTAATTTLLSSLRKLFWNEHPQTGALDRSLPEEDDTDIQRLLSWPFTEDVKDENQGSSVTPAVVWDKLQTVHLEHISDLRNGQSLLLVPLLKRSPNVKDLRLKNCIVSLSRLQGYCKNLQSLHVDGGHKWRVSIPSAETILSASVLPRLQSLAILNINMPRLDMEQPHFTRLMDKLHELTWQASNDYMLNKLLTDRCPRLKKLSIVDWNWGRSHVMEPSRWRCRSTLEELKGAFVARTRLSVLRPVRDVYGSLPMLRRIQISQHQFRFFYAWLYGITIEELNKDAKIDDCTVTVLEDTAIPSLVSSSLAEAASTSRVFQLPQIEVIEVVAEKYEYAIRANELRGVVEAVPNLEEMFYLGKHSPFTNAAWEWIRRARPDIHMEHMDIK